MSYTEINSKTLKGFNINNPGLGGTTPPGESDERTEKAHLESIIEKILLYAPHSQTSDIFILQVTDKLVLVKVGNLKKMQY